MYFTIFNIINMQFLEFDIKNFKGIKRLTIKINPLTNIYTFVGLNESGKTTILEAINAFSNPLKASERHTLIPKGEKYSFRGDIELSAKLKITNIDKEEISKYVQNKGYKYVSIGDTVEVKRKYKFLNSTLSDTSHFWTINITVRKQGGRSDKQLLVDNKPIWNETVNFIESYLFPKTIYYQNFLFDFPERIYLEPIHGESIEYKKYKDIIQDILSSINPSLDLKNDILDRLKTPNDQNTEVLEQLLYKISTVVSDTVFKSWTKLFKTNGKKIEIKHGKEVNNAGTYHYLQFQLKENNTLFSISERSLGFKWFFSFLLFTEFRKNRTTEKSKVLFLLDEPASNLHPTAQKNLLQTFSDLVDKSLLFYTTHSHHLINPLWLNGTYIVTNKALNSLDGSFENNTEIESVEYKKFVSQHPNQKEYFQPILDALDYQPGLLEKIPFVTIVEGKNDYYTFKYILNCYFSEDFELYFYPGGGAFSDESLIRLYESWNREYLVLRDADAAGKKAIEKYTDIFPFIKKKAYTLSDVFLDNNIQVLEDLFTSDERIAITKIARENATKYKKEDFNSGIRHLLFQSMQFDLSEETLDNFKMIFTFLSNNFSANEPIPKVPVRKKSIIVKPTNK